MGGLEWMEGSVPTPNGDIHVYMDGSQIKIKATEGKGYLYIASQQLPQASAGNVEELGAGKYRLWIDTKDEVVVKYNV